MKFWRKIEEIFSSKDNNFYESSPIEVKMGLFSSFIRKKEPTYEPVNRFETLLKEAAQEPSRRPEFYRTLFHFDLVCLGRAKTNLDGSKTAEFQVGNYEGAQVIFAFTSEAALSWYLAKQKLPPTKYIGMKTDVLFGMIQGRMGVILNSGHDFVKYFTPSEVQELLKDQNLESHQVTVPAAQQYRIGQPANLPEVLLSGLAGYSKRSSKVKDIYFGLLGTQEGVLEYIGLVDFTQEASQSDEDSVLKDLIVVSKETLEQGKVMNFCKMRESGFADAIDSGELISISKYGKVL